MSVTRDDVAHVASLARLGLTGERVTALVAELNGILAHMEALQRVPTAATDRGADRGADRAPMSLAPDEPPALPLERPREDFAPLMSDGFFLVPRLSTHDDGAEES